MGTKAGFRWHVQKKKKKMLVEMRIAINSPVSVTSVLAVIYTTPAQYEINILEISLYPHCANLGL